MSDSVRQDPLVSYAFRGFGQGMISAEGIAACDALIEQHRDARVAMFGAVLQGE